MRKDNKTNMKVEFKYREDLFKSSSDEIHLNSLQSSIKILQFFLLLREGIYLAEKNNFPHLAQTFFDDYDEVLNRKKYGSNLIPQDNAWFVRMVNNTENDKSWLSIKPEEKNNLIQVLLKRPLGDTEFKLKSFSSGTADIDGMEEVDWVWEKLKDFFEKIREIYRNSFPEVLEGNVESETSLPQISSEATHRIINELFATETYRSNETNITVGKGLILIAVEELNELIVSLKITEISISS